MSRIITTCLLVCGLAVAAAAEDTPAAAAEDTPAAVAESFWTGLQNNDVEAVAGAVTAVFADQIRAEEPSDDTGIRSVAVGEAVEADGRAEVATTLGLEDEITVDFQTVLVQEEGAWKVDAGPTMQAFMQEAMAVALAQHQREAAAGGAGEADAEAPADEPAEAEAEEAAE